MHTFGKRPFLPLLIAALIFVFIVGCSNQEEAASTEEAGSGSASNEESTEESTEASSEESAIYPITVEHAFGETVIEEKPERVATIQWGNQDVALALGVEPVGFSAANFGVQDDSGLLPWTKEKLDELGVEDPNVFQDTDGLDFEAISDSNPDVILAAYSGITQEDYDLLSEIASVVAYPEAAWATSWREQVTMNAKGMGMEAEGQQLIEDTEAMVQEKVAEYPQIEGKQVVWTNFSADDLSQMHIYTPADSRVKFLEELGMTVPESVTDMIEDPESYSLNLSSENAQALYDADILVGYGNQELLETLQADPLLGEIPAIERGSVVFIESDSPIVAAGTPTPLSISYTIDEYLQMIGDAVDKAAE
ncbi:iron-siderophore ABC transporter substrate-binding protein [Salinicoccus sp. ID82-1]|uniref:iron-siderophore ABC transporter substrate-binding protein n=1 Tax=Salinicoccus sp. ID82-1 TaxID=2820269 RepID=UPI001F42DDCC|nr:iron-siderophore ABC transporter substrate-binding protein [Salinicoccus sp. ID82-1]MCG1008505.1 iron-siderophore ABC transporter substrate-binding protein [Salinicoccus sp. ID82-1]